MQKRRKAPGLAATQESQSGGGVPASFASLGRQWFRPAGVPLGAGVVAGLLLLAAPAPTKAAEGRVTVSLDGVWQIAEGGMDRAPAAFDRTVPVPGLVTLATPAFDPPPGPPTADRRQPLLRDPARDAFWYRRIFRLDGPVPAVARLKVHKAMFGSRVILNGRALGERVSSFTPGWFDARAALRPGENELLIRVGAGRAAVPPDVPSGNDGEKLRFIPGLFDSVELILSGTPHFTQVQTVPDIAGGAVRVQAVLRNDGAATQSAITFTVREAKSGRVAGRLASEPMVFASGAEATVDVRIPLADARRWSPEDPFLYRLEADSGTDQFTTRFGLREFRLDPATGRAVLNGQPYFLRGSNVTLYRFFEDAECRDLPWRADWVRRLHQRVKEMDWNCLRYCIGFPPEAWYDVADELGILIQDEFPLWADITRTPRDGLAREYADWMRERWNHPSVVIWDARNEGGDTPESAAAINAVRPLDLSGRPWDNGFSAPAARTDVYESHPYHYSVFHGANRFTLADLPAAGRQAGKGGHLPNTGGNAVIVNEYGWLWLNRDGTPTTLDRAAYDFLAGPDATVAQRRHTYAVHLAADTEYWRSQRPAGVLHFCLLGYSRPNGQTSDDWIDVEKLAWEPEFHRYLRDAFAPVGLMIACWNDTGIAGRSARVPVRLVNDLGSPWAGAVTLRLRRADDGGALLTQRSECRLDPYGQATVEFALTWPASPGACVLEAELTGAGGRSVRSVRELSIVEARSLGLAFGAKASASSTSSPACAPEYAVDADATTCWSSADTDPAWLAVDLGATRRISRARISWAIGYDTAFSIQVSRDGQAWTDLVSETDGQGGVSEHRFAPTMARHVRVHALTRTTPIRRAMTPGHAIREFQVFE